MIKCNRIGEVLVCRRDTQNLHNRFQDPFAIATCKGTTVVGQVPRWISVIYYVFLGKPGASITYSVAGSRGCRNVLVVAMSLR